MEIENTMRCHYIPIRLAKIKNTILSANDLEQLEQAIWNNTYTLLVGM